jgi:hypothetical protein
MSTLENLFDAKMISDMLLFVMLAVSTILLFEYYEAIETEITQIVLSSLTDVNNSIAETQVGR